jgi:hypothetical protein
MGVTDLGDGDRRERRSHAGLDDRVGGRIPFECVAQRRPESVRDTRLPSLESRPAVFQYIVRVRGTAYVWGSATLTAALSEPLMLVLNNDARGDEVEIGSEQPQGPPTVLGVLKPGECWTLMLTGLRGVTATCADDTTLACAILTPG